MDTRNDQEHLVLSGLWPCLVLKRFFRKDSLVLSGWPQSEVDDLVICQKVACDMQKGGGCE